MLPFFTEEFGNPASSLHIAGRRAATAVENAREHVAGLIKAHSSQIVFTSGATESNNIVVHGLTRTLSAARRKIVTTAIEHKSILEPIKGLVALGYEVQFLPVDNGGLVDCDAARSIIDSDTLLVSVQTANNEIGSVQPIAEIAKIAHASGALIHSDAAQGVGKISVDVRAFGVDFLSISAHKLYGPKGVGALYVRERPYSRHLTASAQGGGQEGGLRPGTHNVPGIVGFGEACHICQVELPQEAERIAFLRNRLEDMLRARIADIRVNGSLQSRLPGNSSLTFPGVPADALILNVPNLALSMGSACSSGTPEPSYVLTSIGVSRTAARSTIRVGVGRYTDETEIDTCVADLTEAYARLGATAVAG